MGAYSSGLGREFNGSMTLECGCLSRLMLWDLRSKRVGSAVAVALAVPGLRRGEYGLEPMLCLGCGSDGSDEGVKNRSIVCWTIFSSTLTSA